MPCSSSHIDSCVIEQQQKLKIKLKQLFQNCLVFAIDDNKIYHVFSMYDFVNWPNSLQHSYNVRMRRADTLYVFVHVHSIILCVWIVCHSKYMETVELPNVQPYVILQHFDRDIVFHRHHKWTVSPPRAISCETLILPMFEAYNKATVLILLLILSIQTAIHSKFNGFWLEHYPFPHISQGYGRTSACFIICFRKLQRI